VSKTSSAIAIVYGKLAVADWELDSTSFECGVPALLGDYAHDFGFSLNLTPQTLSAFPLLWNHRYPDLYEE
jgi:hypothetical protein